MKTVIRILRVLVVFCVATFVPDYIVGSSESEAWDCHTTRIADKFKLKASHFIMQGRARVSGAVKVNAPQAVGFKCVHCNGGFGSRRAMDTHRRHQKSIGTPCADPKSSKSQSFTTRSDMSTGILRQHDAATLGKSMLRHKVDIYISQIHALHAQIHAIIVN